MRFKNIISAVFGIFFAATNVFGYKIESGESFIGTALGINVNVLRYDVKLKETPQAQLPLALSYEYAIDKNIGAFIMTTPHFAADSVGIHFGAGLKYWFSSFNAPYVPFISLAFTPAFLLPVGESVRHTNLGVTSAVGVNFFILADFLVGTHVAFHPSYAMIDADRKFEFSVSGMFDVTFRI